ncbi:MAG: STAS domain-containing protein [Pseudomonadales bacterium]|nr:STAS domain-containing protein [Pseudomonadales bacterium]
MSEGRVLAASHEGAYVIRFEGDVRLTLCTTIDDYFEHMYEDPEFFSVWVDLCDAEGLDSTTLGLLAKLALTVKERFGFQPTIYSCNAGINRLVRSMGFQRLFELREQVCANPDDVTVVPTVPGSEQAVKDKIIEAHRVLMGLNPTNRARFKDLLAALEGG